MVTVKSVNVRRRDDGKVETEARITAASGDTITAADLELNTIEIVKSVIPEVADHVVTGVTVTNPGSYGNSFTLKAYTLTAGSLVTEAGSIDWAIVAIGE
jgi:hypothetical protein